MEIYFQPIEIPQIDLTSKGSFESKYNLRYFIQDPKTLDGKTAIQTFSDKDIQDGPSSKTVTLSNIRLV